MASNFMKFCLLFYTYVLVLFAIIIIIDNKSEWRYHAVYSFHLE